MYVDALSFLEDEREAWRPYEALDQLSDAQLEEPVEAAHGWSGRDLIGHLIGWQEAALSAAKQLAVNETSPSMTEIEADWARRPDELNEELLAPYRAMPVDELRRRFRTIPGELRGYLTVVPESRWIKRADNQEWFVGETLEHYEEHLPDLHAILRAARGG